METDQGEGEWGREEEQRYCHVFLRSSFYVEEKGSPLSKRGNSIFLPFSCFSTRQAVTRASSCHGSLREEGLEADARYFNKALTSPDSNGVISEKLTGSPAGHPGCFPGLIGDYISDISGDQTIGGSAYETHCLKPGLKANR